MNEPSSLTIHELLPQLRLTGVTFYKVAAELDESQRVDDIASKVESEDFDVNHGMRIRHEDNELGIRVRTEILTSVGSVIVDAAAEYESDEPLPITRELAFEFANEVGVMVVLPYIREAITTISLKVLGAPLLMPIIQRGQMSFSPND